MAVVGAVYTDKNHISCEYSTIKSWLRGRDVSRIQKISDARTIKNCWMRGLPSHVRPWPSLVLNHRFIVFCGLSSIAVRDKNHTKINSKYVIKRCWLTGFESFFLSIKFAPCLGPRTWKNMSPDHFKTQEMCIEAVQIELNFLTRVPDPFKTQEMCNEAVRNKPYTLRYDPDHFKMQEMCYKAVDCNPCQLVNVPNHLKIKEMCNKVVDDCPWQLGDDPHYLKAREIDWRGSGLAYMIAEICPWLVCDTTTTENMVRWLLLQWW